MEAAQEYIPAQDSEEVPELERGFIPGGRVPSGPHLENLDAVRREFAKLYRELRVGRTGLKRASLMLQSLREVRESLVQKTAPSINHNTLVVTGEIPPSLRLVQELFRGREADLTARIIQDRPVEPVGIGVEPDGSGASVAVPEVPRDSGKA